jgi:tetratricopeptide (TPR) repeat protein
MSQAVFISYAAKDKRVADAVCQALEDNGVRCWIAPRDVLPGMEYAAAIIDALNSCQLFLVIFSETSNSSPQVAREVERAVSKNRTILTFRIDNTALSKAMEYYLSDRHWMDASSGKFTQQLDNLVKAVKALEAVLPPGPNEADTVNKDLHKVKAAEEKTRLDALLAKADEAIKSARWEEATGFLLDALAIKPNEAVEAKLAEVRSKQRSAGLIEIKTQAQGLARAERYNEALEAWNEYLSLKPDDHEEVERTLQDLRKAAKITREYGKSQEAIRRKRYNRAIGLLQGIVAQEPTYKDSSRLLMEAEQAKKSIPSWRRNWLFEITGVVVVILLGIFFGPKLWVAISPPIQQTPITLKTNSPTFVLPTFTTLLQAPPTLEALNRIPALPADLVSLQPILAYVTSSSPDFADDFSKTNNAWDPFQAGITMTNGVLRLNMQAGTPTEKIGPSAPFMEAKNFWLEFDFYYVGGKGDTTINYAFPTTSDSKKAAFDFHIDLEKQDWFIGFTDNSNTKSGYLGESLKGKWSHLLIINLNTQVVVFLDGELLGHVEGIDRNSNAQFWLVAVTTEQAEVWLDNVKFWNLDSFNNSFASPGFTAVPLSTAISTPEPMPTLESIKNHLTGHAPSFEDDFSKVNNSWDSFPAGVTINDGVLQMTLEGGTPTEKIGLSSPYMNANNFWLEFDFYFESGSRGTTIDTGFPSKGNGSGTNCTVMIDFVNQDWFIGLTDRSTGKSGHISESMAGKWSHLQVVYSGSQVIVFLNDKLLDHVEGISRSGNQNWIVAQTNGQAKIKFDNVEFWDLDKIPNLP